MTDIDKLAREIAAQFCEPTELEVKIAVAAMKLQRERDAVQLDGWREWDWPEGVSRSAVAHVAEHFASAIRSAL